MQDTGLDPLACAVCRRSVVPRDGFVVLGVDGAATRPSVESVAVVCADACRGSYEKPGQKLVFGALAELRAEPIIRELMPRFHWEPWTFDPFLAIVAAVTLRSRPPQP
jgi:hypothetical protein